MAFGELDSKIASDLWTVPVSVQMATDGAEVSTGSALRAGKPEVFLQTPANERYPVFSPDGRCLAYSSNESGTEQIYVRAFPDKGGKWQISNGGGRYPMWLAGKSGGQSLFFETADGHIMAAAYTVKGDSFVADKPRPWSDRQLTFAQGQRNFDLAPDGKRIVALMPVESSAWTTQDHEVVMLQNFADELRGRLGWEIGAVVGGQFSDQPLRLRECEVLWSLWHAGLWYFETIYARFQCARH